MGGGGGGGVVYICEACSVGHMTPVSIKLILRSYVFDYK